MRSHDKITTCVLVFQEVLKQLQGNIKEDSKESQGQIEFLERFKGEDVKRCHGDKLLKTKSDMHEKRRPEV